MQVNYFLRETLNSKFYVNHSNIIQGVPENSLLNKVLFS